MSKSWQELVADKKERQKASVPKEWIIKLPEESVLDVTRVPEECGLLSPREIEITNTDVENLLEKLAKGQLSSVEVTTAFAKRAVIAQQLVNCLTEIFVDGALKRAAELDEHLKRTGKVVGPLHGLPISLKDQISIKGLETTMGYVSWIGEIAKENAVLADIVIAAGAVPYVRTNIPQTLMWSETFNHVFGRTLNPHNRSLTSGGSSGGEGALLGMRGSPLGVGSDIGGSVRIPSAFNGIYGMRPSYGRVPYGKAKNSLEGSETVLSVFGPHSHSIGGLKAFMKAVIAQKPWLKDPLALRKKWDEESYQLEDHGRGKGLCFAILWDDGLVVPHPPIIRGLEETKKALIAAGHKVIDWKPLNHPVIYDILGEIWGAGAQEDYRNTTAPTGEPIVQCMEPGRENDASDATFRQLKEGISAYELWQLQLKKREFRQAYLDYWEKTVEVTGTGRPVDAIISPVAAHTAVPHGKNKSLDYTMVWNALDYSALVVPVSKVDPAVDVKKPAHKFLSDRDRENYELYEPAAFVNAPIGIQIIGRTHEEEAVIGMSEIVDAALKNRNK